MQGCPAGHKDLQTGTVRQQIGDERSGLSKVLKIVEDQQKILLLQGHTDQLGERTGHLLAQSQRLRERGFEQCWIAKRGQGDKDRPLLKTLAEILRKLNREPCLADATGAGEREQAHAIALQEGQGTRHLLLPPDERCRRKWWWGHGTGPGGRYGHLWSDGGEEQGPLGRG